MYEYKFTFDEEGRRILVGLTCEETAELHELEAQLPIPGAELRWLELFNKHEHAREALAA